MIDKIKDWIGTLGCLQVSILIILFTLAIIPLGYTFFSDPDVSITDLALNLGTEMLGATLIFIMLDIGLQGQKEREEALRKRRLQRYQASKRSEKEEAEKKKLQLDTLIDLRQAPDEEVRNAILHKMRQLDLLEGAELESIVLSSVMLPRANLKQANFWHAKLNGAFLMASDLSQAHLKHTDLANAQLQYANLKDAQLWYANLSGVDLTEANLEGVEFVDPDWLILPYELIKDLQAKGKIDLRGETKESIREDVRVMGKMAAEIWYAVCNEDTILPDGTKWTRQTDLERFSNPHHPDFWRSRNKNSPAYISKR